jgi:hypothetical protein
MVVADSAIEKFFCEPGINDEGNDDDNTQELQQMKPGLAAA